MKEFDWNEFKSNRIAVHCRTEEESENFCKLMVKNSTPVGGNYWERYKENTCYTYNNDSGYYDSYYSTIKYYELEGYTILEWSDYMEDNDMPELKLGMIVENEN